MKKADQAYEQARLLMESESSYKQGVESLKEAADLGHAKAQYNLGICLHQGLGTLQSFEEAYRYFTLAAKQNHPRAYYMLGCYFAFGYLFPISLGEAALYFRLAAEAGVADAQYDLGVLLLNADAEEEAVRYFKLAAQQENSDALYNLGICYYEGRGVRPSREEAIAYLELAVRKKHPKAGAALETVLMQTYHPPTPSNRKTR